MPDELFSVTGQVTLVSGGSRGIGKAIAAGFARRGAKVILTGRQPETVEAASAELSTADAPVQGLVCDVCDADAIRRTVRSVIDDYDQIDTLINVAGVNRRMPAEDVTEEDYDFILDTNLKGAFVFSQEAGRHMISRGQGNQINVVSLNNYAPLKHVAPYAMSKAGLGHMTRTLALEWGPKGVRVNAIAPGFILTDLTRKLWARPDMQAWALPNTPLGRLGEPEDMLGAALFLASSASAFMTGQILFVDGGFSAGLRWPIDAE